MTLRVMLDLAAPAFISDRDAGDEHAYPSIADMAACPECGAPNEPEPTPLERAWIFERPDYEWVEPPGVYLRHGYGLMGGGFGNYVTCERCGFFHKEQSRHDD